MTGTGSPFSPSPVPNPRVLRDYCPWNPRNPLAEPKGSVEPSLGNTGLNHQRLASLSLRVETTEKSSSCENDAAEECIVLISMGRTPMAHSERKVNNLVLPRSRAQNLPE